MRKIGFVATLLHSYALRQITRHIYGTTKFLRRVIGQELEGDRINHWRQQWIHFRYSDNMVDILFGFGVLFGNYGNHRRASRLHLFEVGQHNLVSAVVGDNGNNWHIWSK